MLPARAVAALLLIAATSALAQPAGVTLDMINTTLPEEGAPKAVAGKYAVTSGPTYGAAGLTAYYPQDLSAFPRRDSLPVVVWGNGGCAIDNPRYAGFLSTIASHGFLVLTTAAKEGTPAQQRATADDLKAAIDWTTKENTRAGAPLAGKIRTDRVAVMGQSCGGALSLALGLDPRVTTIGVFNAGAQAAAAGQRSVMPSFEDLKGLHGPVLLINGHERDFMMAASRATFEAIDTLPVFYGARHGAGHTATAYHPGGGEFANVATNWALWQLKGDGKAAQMFVGSRCSLCTNPNWDVGSKRLSR
jgi:dienelactone hydrolase